MRVASAFAAVLAAGAVLFAVRALAQTAAGPSPSPLPAVESYAMLEDEYTPYYEGNAHGGNSLNVNAQFPFVTPIAHDLYLLRVKIPFTTWAPTGAPTGNGDTNLIALAAVRPKPISFWALGACATLPTGSINALGSGKWAAGPAVQYGYKAARWRMGMLFRQFFSIAGSGARAPYVRTKFAPTVDYDAGSGWHVGTSTMTFQYDWYARRWIDVPIGVAVGKGISFGSHAVYADVQFERNLANYSGSPEYTLRSQLKYSF